MAHCGLTYPHIAQGSIAMQYLYSDKYGDRSIVETRKRLKDRQGNEIPWQSEHDAAVDKGLMQVMKEDKLPFSRLLAILRAETVKAMHSADRWRIPAYQMLDKYIGGDYACPDGTPATEALRYYWYDHLDVSRDSHPGMQK